MINLQTEKTISLSQLTRLLPPGRSNRPVTISCVLRWIMDGMKDHNGQIVRLEGIRVGGRWLTSIEALNRFADRLTPNLDGQHPTLPRSPTARKRESERAALELEKLGI
jgi:hypothetical protein